LTHNNKRTAKVYKIVKDLQQDIKKSHKIVILKSCIGYVIESNNQNNENIDTKKKVNQYRIHKIEEGKILKFEKFCFIETTKCDQQQHQHHQQQNNIDENYLTIKTINSSKIISGSSTTHTACSSHSKKSSFLSILSNLINSSNNSTIRSSRSKLNTPDLTTEHDDPLSNYYNRRIMNKSNPITFTHHFEDPNQQLNNSSKIVRVAKCYDVDTDAIVYIRDSSEGEFMIDASISLVTTSHVAPSQYYLSPIYLYDIKTLTENDFLFEINKTTTNLQFELIMKRSTKMNRLPFVNIFFTPSDQIVVRNQLTVIVYDVNRNKFFEYYLNDLLQLTKFYKFYKSINNDDLLNKYKAKLDWCMETIHEFKFDVKIRFPYLQNNLKMGYYLEQYLFRTYSRRNFRRRTDNSTSLPLKNINTQDFENEDREEEESEELNEDHKDNKIKRIIKLATTGKYIQKQKEKTTNEELSIENKRKLSSQSTESKSNYSTVRNKLAAIFQNPGESSKIKDSETKKQFVTVIDVNVSTNSINVGSDYSEDYYKKNKKVFKRPTLFNSFNKQSSYITSSSIDISDDDPRSYYSKIQADKDYERRPNSSRGMIESTPQPKRSIQNFLNIRKIKKESKTDGFYTPTNKSFEVTAI
jgi:hypothetical protein